MQNIVWDFDGTLAYRRGGWSDACATALADAGYEVDPDAIRPHLDSGFPWHHPEEPHTELDTADAWWSALEPVFVRAFREIGLQPHAAEELAGEVRPIYLHSNWATYDDTIRTLRAFDQAGAEQFILSNHVPELPRIVHELGIDPHIQKVYTSAEIGFEKPHPEAFEPILDIGDEDDTTIMVGDSYRADIAGARSVDLAAVLVRDSHPDVDHSYSDLDAVVDDLLETDDR